MVKAQVFGPGTYDACANKVKRLTGVLLIFHPGCSHCVQMRPAWEETKRELSPDTNVVEVDASEMAENKAMNETEAIRARGFPSLFLMKQGHIIKEFTGERKSEDMKNFSQSLNVKGVKLRKTKRTRKRPFRKSTKRKRTNQM